MFKTTIAFFMYNNVNNYFTYWCKYISELYEIEIVNVNVLIRVNEERIYF